MTNRSGMSDGLGEGGEEKKKKKESFPTGKLFLVFVSVILF